MTNRDFKPSECQYKMSIQNWIERMMSQAVAVQPSSSLQMELTHKLIETSFNYQLPNKLSEIEQIKERGIVLACAFDLLVAADYYKGVSHADWLYCPRDEPLIFYPYTNCCPRCALTNSFVFHGSKKLKSGQIGVTTSHLLTLYLKEIFEHNKRGLEVLKGCEPVDIIIRDQKIKKVFFGEIKASPLLTPPLCAMSQKLTEEVAGNSVERAHTSTENSSLFGSKLSILVPVFSTEIKNWTTKCYELPPRNNISDKEWGYRGILKLLDKQESFFNDFYSFWRTAFSYYHPKNTNAVFWLTNACGTPSPIPSNWPQRRRGEGYETISDSKTSVGIDRTDDIKKGVYQLLKIGSEGKPNISSWEFKVGLVTNIHPLRHFDEYISSIRDIVWTVEPTGKVKKAKDLPPDQELYNLFDGIIALTHITARDDWVKQVFDFYGGH